MTKAGEAPESAAGDHSPWAIAFVVAIATFMEVLDTTIANVALRYISGGLAIGPDEAAWVVTSYLVANAIALTASSFLAKRYGRKMFFMLSVGLFTVASVLCGFAWSLESLLFFRVLQGLGGGGMAPLAQSILADAFPPEKRGQAFAVYGVAIVVAPVIGPTLGGWLSDNLSWHWCFLINGPIGAASLGLVWWLLQDPRQAVEERERLRREGVRFDVVGFVLVALFLGSLEVILDEGLRADWFDSSFIDVFAIVCGVALAAMIPWLLTRRNPAVDLRLLGRRQFAACFVVMLGTGAILIATTQFVPQIVQEQYGYNATLAGLVLAPGGMVTVAAMLLAGRLSSRIEPKWMIVFGSTLICYGLYSLTWLQGESTFWFFTEGRMWIGAGLPFVFLSVTAASYVGLRPGETDQASAQINMARNIGGSLGVSLAQNTLAHREQFHQSRLVEHINADNPAYQRTIAQAQSLFVSQGMTPGEAQSRAFSWAAQQVQSQVAFWAYIDVFLTLAVVAALIIPCALFMKTRKSASGEARQPG